MGKAEDFRKQPPKDRKDDGRGGVMPQDGKLDIPKKQQKGVDQAVNNPDGRSAYSH